MKLTLRQNFSEHSKLYTFSNPSGNIVSIAKIHGEKTVYERNGGKSYVLYNRPCEKKSIISYGLQYVPLKIVGKDDSQLSFVVSKQSDTLPYYSYLHFLCDSDMYDLYYIGNGFEGYSFPVYKNENMAALIERKPLLKGYSNEYQIYILDEKDEEIVSIMALYIDWLMFTSTNRFQFKGTLNYTVNSKLREKYNPLIKELS